MNSLSFDEAIELRMPVVQLIDVCAVIRVWTRWPSPEELTCEEAQYITIPRLAGLEKLFLCPTSLQKVAQITVAKVERVE